MQVCIYKMGRGALRELPCVMCISSTLDRKMGNGKRCVRKENTHSYAHTKDCKYKKEELNELHEVDLRITWIPERLLFRS